MSEDKYSDKKFHKLTCSNCRKKKARCDGTYPFCVNCRNSKQKCVYDKPASISYVRHLEKQVELLEKKLQSFERDEGSTGSTSIENDQEHLSNKQLRDHNEGLEFNTTMLTSLMTDMDIKGAPQILANISYVPFSYISDTLRFAHFFDGPLHKEPTTEQITGSQFIQLVTSIRQKYSDRKMTDKPDKDLIRDYIITGVCVSAHGFPFFRPHYVNKYFRDFQNLLEHCITTLESDNTSERDRFGFDSREVVASFALASKVFHRAIVSPFVQSTHLNEEQDSKSKARILLYIDETFKMQNRLYDMIGQNLFGKINPSIAQTCLHASITEVMLGGSLNTATLLNNFSCRISIELFAHYTSLQDGASAIWFLRALWACYIWDKIISSCCNRNPIFPNPPPLAPSDIQFNPMDTLPSIDKDGKLILEIDGRPAIIACCRLSIILSDILLRRHHFTNIRIHLYEVIDEIQSNLPDELSPDLNFPFDKPVHKLDPLKVVNLPPNYPVELILPVAMLLLIRLELYCESFVNIAENLEGAHPNTAENKYSVFQGLVKNMKICSAFAQIVSDAGPYGDIAASASYINPWFRLLIMKSLYKVLMNDDAVKLLAIVTGEVPSDELTDEDEVPSYEFVDKSNNVSLQVPESDNDDSLPAELFVQNIVFAFNGSSNFVQRQTKNRYYYLKFMISMYILVCQRSVRRLAEFRSPLSREVLGQSLVTRPAILDVFSDQHERVCAAVRQLPNPKFDEDLSPEYSYSKLLKMVNSLGEFGETLLRPKKSTSSAASSKSGGERSESVSSNAASSAASPISSGGKKRNRQSDMAVSQEPAKLFSAQQGNRFQPQLPVPSLPILENPPYESQQQQRQLWTPNISVSSQQQQYPFPAQPTVPFQHPPPPSHFNEAPQHFIPQQELYQGSGYGMPVSQNPPLQYPVAHFQLEPLNVSPVQPEFGIHMNYQQRSFQPRSQDLNQQYQQLPPQLQHYQQINHQNTPQNVQQNTHHNIQQLQNPLVIGQNPGQFPAPDAFQMFFNASEPVESTGVNESYSRFILQQMMGADFDSLVNLEGDNTLGFSNIFGPMVKDDRL